jgi:hypothetical protein
LRFHGSGRIAGGVLGLQFLEELSEVVHRETAEQFIRCLENALRHFDTGQRIWLSDRSAGETFASGCGISVVLVEGGAS